MADRREANSAHVAGVDSLRFIAALWVAIAHGAGLPLRELFRGGGIFSHAIAGAVGVAFSGPAAVTVFFIVSGLCIHLPFVRAEKVEIREYLVRRYVRIGGPLLVVLLAIHLFSDPAVQAARGVLWSVYCEIAYYTLYPLLFPVFRRYGLKPAIVAATAVSALLIVAKWRHLYSWQFGPLTFLTAFPAWLLGCLIAERMAKNALPEPKVSIWYWRTGAWLYSVFALLAVFHLPIRIGYPATLSVFSFYCYFWLQRELQRWRVRSPWRWTETGGAWSYSMYLVHMSVITAFGEWRLPVPVLVNWALKFAAVLLTSYIFHVLIESPSHSAARRWGRSIGRPRAVPATGY